MSMINIYLLTLSNYQNFAKDCFVKTEDGSTSIDVGLVLTSGFDIYNFKYYEGFVYFCGTYNTQGFIAWAKIDAVFSSGQFEYELVANTSVIYDLEVFLDNASQNIKVVALGYNENTTKYSFIDYTIYNGNSGLYDIYETYYILQNITLTKNYVAVVFSNSTYPYDEFGVIRHEKNYIQNYQSQMYAFAYSGQECLANIYRKPENRRPRYLIEYIGEESVVIATVITQNASPNFSGELHPFALYNINLNTFGMYSSLIIPNLSKPYVKDMVYLSYNQTLHLIVNGEIDKEFTNTGSEWIHADFIYECQPWNTTYSYLPTIIAPVVNASNTLNSIDKYDDTFYIVGGVSIFNQQPANLYWFDRQTTALGSDCYKNYEAKLYYDPPIPMGTMNYYSTSWQSSITNAYFFSISDVYSSICED